MMKRMILTAVFALGMVIGALITLPQANAAASHCPATYVVRRGDTLTNIAARAGMNIWQLARLNQLWNVHHIYVGQILCVPYPIAAPQVDSLTSDTTLVTTSDTTSTIASDIAPSKSSFDLEVEYKFERQAEITATSWTVGKQQIAGKRLSYSLVSGDAIETAALHEFIAVSSTTRTPGPILWLVPHIDTLGPPYTMVVIGDPQLLLDLQLGFTKTVTQIFGTLPTDGPQFIEDALSIAGMVALTQVKAKLVSTDNIYVPLTISKIDYQETAEIARSNYPDPAFALHPAPLGDGYQLLMVLNDDGSIGPPGYGWRGRCRGWRGGGWWSRWARSWYGC